MLKNGLSFLSKVIEKTVHPVRLFYAIILLDLGLIVILLLIANLSKEVSFVTEALTERAAIRFMSGSKSPDWPDLQFEPEGAASSECSGRVELPDIVEHPFEAIITARSDGAAVDLVSDGPSLGTLVCEDGKRVSAPKAAFATVTPPLEEGSGASPDSKKTLHPLTLAFEGELRLGAVPNEGSSDAALLQQGIITMEAIKATFGAGRLDSQSPLRLGDSAQVEDDHGRPARSYGVIRFGPRAAHVVARAKGRKVLVTAIGQDRGEAIAISPSMFDQFQALPGWATLLAIAAVALNCLGAAQSFGQWRFGGTAD